MSRLRESLGLGTASALLLTGCSGGIITDRERGLDVPSPGPFVTQPATDPEMGCKDHRVKTLDAIGQVSMQAPYPVILSFKEGENNDVPVGKITDIPRSSWVKLRLVDPCVPIDDVQFGTYAGVWEKHQPFIALCWHEKNTTPNREVMTLVGFQPETGVNGYVEVDNSFIAPWKNDATHWPGPCHI